MDELAQLNFKYQSTLIVGKLGGWEYNSDTNQLFCSHEYFAMLGRGDAYPLSWEQYDIKDVWEIFLHPDDLQNAIKIFADFLTTRKGTYEQIFRLQHANGSWLWILSRGMAIVDNETGLPSESIIGAHIDITDNKKMQEDPLLSKHKLVKDNALLKSIINSPQNLFIVAMDRNFHLTAFTDSYVHYAKTVLKKMITVGMSAFDIIPKNLHAFALKNYTRALAGESFTIANELLAPNGTLFHYENRYSPITDARGIVHGITLFINDVTEIKRNEESTKINELRYAALFDGAADAIFIADVDTGLVVDANHQATILIGYTKEEIIGMHQNQIHPKEEFDYIKNEFKRLREENKTERVECHIVHQSLKKIPVSVIAGKPFKVGDKTYSAGFFRDLTKDKAAQEKIISMENLLMRAEGIANLGSIEVDLVNQTHIWSDEFYRILGFKPRTIAPDKAVFLSLVHPDDRARNEHWFDVSSKSLSPIEPIEVRITSIDGNEKYLFLSAVNHVNEQGKIDKYFGVVKDVTEITKTLQELRKQNTQLKEIAWSQSHLVRAPLSRILGLILLLQKGMLGREEEIEFIEYIKQSAEELDKIIKDIVYKANGLDTNDLKNT